MFTNIIIVMFVMCGIIGLVVDAISWHGRSFYVSGLRFWVVGPAELYLSFGGSDGGKGLSLLLLQH